MASFADYLAAYGGSPDPENPSSGTITPGALLDALRYIDQAGSSTFGKMATDLATLPRRAIEGAGDYQPGVRRSDVTDIPGSGFGSEPADVAVGPSTEAAMTIAGIASPFAEPGSAGIFGGRLAKNAPLDKYAQADAMLAKGATKEEILAQTGLTLGPDFQLRHEIPDINSRMTDRMAPVEQGRQVRPGTVGAAFEHPDLYAAYPELADTVLKMSDPSARPGYMSRGGVSYHGNIPDYLTINQKAYTPAMSKAMGDLEPGLPGMRSTMLHELQHLVQNIEGFARGGTPWVPEVQQVAKPEIAQLQTQIDSQLANLRQTRIDWMNNNALKMRAAGATPEQIAQKFIQDNPNWGNEFFKAQQAKGQAPLDVAFKHYNNLAGEQESNAVQARANMTPEQLAATPLWETMTTPYAEQLQRFMPAKGRAADLSTAPSFSERMSELQDVAQERRNRGFSTGDYGLGTARRTAPDAPKGSFERFAAEQRAGFQGDKADIINAYREATGSPRLGNEQPLLAPGETSLEFSTSRIGEPYRPPDLEHPITDIKLRKPISEMSADIKSKPVSEKRITPADLQGGLLLPAIGDRSVAGGRLTGVGGEKLSKPVELQGGHGYMPANTERGVIWAGAPGVISSLQDKAALLAESGKPVYFPYTAMGPQSVDFSHHVSDTISGMLPSSRIASANKGLFNEEMRSVAPDFPGVGSANLRTWLQEAPGKTRDAFAKMMAKAKYQDIGFPDVAEARYAVTDPRLLDVPTGASGLSISRLGGGTPGAPTRHGTYAAGMPGEYVGGFGTSIPKEDMYPDIVRALDRYRANMPAGKYVPTVDYLMGRTPKGEPIAQKADQRWVDRVSTLMRSRGLLPAAGMVALGDALLGQQQQQGDHGGL